MRISTPTALLLLIATPMAHAQQAGGQDKEALPAKYERLLAEAGKKPPVIEQIFKDSYTCVAYLPGGTGKVQASEAKVNNQMREQQAQIQRDQKTLASADAAIDKSIENTINSKLKNVNTAGVDVCKGENNAMTSMLDDANRLAKQAAANQIDETANKLSSGAAALKREANGQLATNANDRPEDVSKLDGAIMASFGAANTACKKLQGSVRQGIADAPIREYLKELERLEKKIADWKASKKLEMNAKIDAKTDGMKVTATAKKDCSEMKNAEAAPAAQNKPDSKVSEAKPKAAAEQKSGLTGTAQEKSLAEAKPATKTEADKAAVNAAPTTEGAAKFKTDPTRVSEGATLDALKNSEKSVFDTGTTPVSGATSNGTQGQTSLPQDTTAYSTDRASLNSPAAGTSSNPFDVGAASASKTGGTGIQQNDGLYETLDRYSQRTPSSGTNDTGSTGNTTPAPSLDATTSKQIKANYQSDAFFKSRDLDFASSKDSRIMQNALNQVGGSQISADGVFGAQSVARLDAVMKDPVQKAAFMKALKVQMSR